MSTMLKRCPQKDCYELIPVKDIDCGKHVRLCARCQTRPPRTARSNYCDECTKAVKLEYNRGRTKPEPYAPAPKSPPKMTDRQQRLHDLALEQKLAARCGYGHGEARRLTPEEIAAIAGEITHVSAIPQFHDGRSVTW